MSDMNSPEKKERKKRAKKELPPPMLSGGKRPAPRPPMTDEEFEQRLVGFFMLVEGLLRAISADQFPDELDVE